MMVLPVPVGICTDNTDVNVLHSLSCGLQAHVFCWSCKSTVSSVSHDSCPPLLDSLMQDHAHQLSLPQQHGVLDRAPAVLLLSHPGPACAHNNTYLQQAMPSCIQGAFELQHVAILLWIDVLIREVHRQALKYELHAAVSHPGRCRLLYQGNKMSSSECVCSGLSHHAAWRSRSDPRSHAARLLLQVAGTPHATSLSCSVHNPAT